MKSKSVAKINAIIAFPTSVKFRFVCFTVTGSFLITVHLFWQFEFPWLNLTNCPRMSRCERISPDPLGYRSKQQIGRNLMLIYPTLGLGPGHVPQRSDIFFPHGRDLAGFEPRTFRFQGFPEGRSGCERISPDPLGYRATPGCTSGPNSGT